jgi:hypothetical protein
MKLVQLLTGTAVAALLAGAAQAQLADVAGTVNNDILSPSVVAAEQTGVVSDEILITFNAIGGGNPAPFASVGANETVEFNITLTNATFTSALAADVWDTDSVNASNACSFGNIFAGGGLGQNFVTWQNQLASGAACTQALFDSDIAIAAGDIRARISRTDASQPVTISYGFRPAGSANFTADTQSETLIVTANAYDAEATAGAVADVLLNATGTAFQGAANGDLGSVTAGFTAVTTAAIALPTGGNVAAGATIRVDGDAANTTAAADTVAAVTAGDGIAAAGDIVATIQFADLTGIAGVTFDGVACDLDTTANTATCDDLTPANFDGGANDVVFTLTAATDDVVAVQTPTVALAVTDNAEFDIAGFAATPLAAITWDDGVTSRIPLDAGTGLANSFPWTNLRTSGGTQSNFRITGLRSDFTTDADEGIFVTVTNTNGALPGDATAQLDMADVTITADGVADDTWTATFNSTAVANALGVTTEALNGDISFETRVFDAAPAGVGEAARLLIKNGIVTSTSFDG